MIKILFIIFAILSNLQSFAQIIELDTIPMVFVQGGTYKMGCTAEQRINCDSLNESLKEKCTGGCFEWELPVHCVTVADFYICQFEITQKQWTSIMGSNPSYFKGDNYPVESVSWLDVQNFIKRLNAETGRNYRLPTEAEWEYAARGGILSENQKFSGNNEIDSVAWYKENSYFTTHSVGTKQPNELGIYDMSGNVWEWCSDIFLEYEVDNINNHQMELPDEKYYVLRGGSWDSGKITTRVSFRYDELSNSDGIGIGFRLVHSIEQ
jgi:formylglycine-generating enzyme required for sulfatase activity